MSNLCPAFKSPDDPTDYVYEHIARAPPGAYVSEFPEEYDMCVYAQPSRHQGNRSSCAAFTAAAIKEIHEKRDCGFDEWMSPEFIYYHRDNKPGTGMYGRNVFQILQRIGSVPESQFPYKDTDMDIPCPDSDLYNIARQYRIANFARVISVEGLKRALLELGPCYLLLPLYNNDVMFWIDAPNISKSESMDREGGNYNVTTSSVNIVDRGVDNVDRGVDRSADSVEITETTMYTIVDTTMATNVDTTAHNIETIDHSRREYQPTGHSVTVVGYKKEGFILKNSWGNTWNGDGCVIFPYSDWGKHWECWVCVDSTMPLKKKKCTVL